MNTMIKKRYGLAAVLVVIAFATTTLAFAEGEGEKAINYGLLSLFTPVIAILLSFITKQVILSLTTAVLVGATIVNSGNILNGFLRTCDTYIVGTVTDSWNGTLLIFILAVGGLVSLMARMGGTQAMAIELSKKAKNSRNSLVITWILGILIFFEDMANSLIVGPTMRPVTDKHNISREKLSYVIDSTAGPVTDMALISSWVAYEISMIGIAFAAAGIAEFNAYSIFLKTIPFRFYNIFAVAMVIIIILQQRDYGPMYHAEKRARLTGKLYADNAKPMMSKELDAMNVKEGTPLRMRNAIVPILSFVIVTIVAMWFTGGGMEEPFGIQGIQNSFGNCDSASSILYAVIFTSILTGAMAVIQKIMTLKECVDVWVDGCKELLLTVCILVLAWSSGAVMRDLGTGAYIAGLVGDSIPSVILPAVLFLVACLVAFSTGTSYGTTAIMIPIAFPLAMALTGGDVTSLSIGTIAAVTCGAIFGDHCSPISDTTIMSAMGSAADLMDHVKTQLPYAVTVAAISVVFGFIPAALGVSPWLLIPIGIIALWIIVRIVGKSTKLEDLQKL